MAEKKAPAPVPREQQPYALPEGWVWAYGKDIFASMQSTKPDGIEFEYIDIDAIDNKNQRVIAPKIIETVKAPSRASRKLHPGDTVFSLVRPYLKNIAYIDESLSQCIASTGFYVCTPTQHIDSHFTYWLMCSPYVVDGLTKYMKGDNSPSIRKNDIENFLFPLPPLSEQQRIVEKIESLFARLDAAKAKLQQVLAGSEARRAAILHEAFSGGLTGEKAEEGQVPKGWSKVQLSDVCSVNPSKINTKDLNDEMQVSFFPMSSLDEKVGEITKPEVKTLKEVKKGFTNFEEGDVVFAKITPCMENGKSAVIGPLVNDIGYGSTEFYVLRCHEELNNRFLFHLVRSQQFRDKAKAHMSGAVGQQRVPRKFLEEYIMNLPPMKEQIRIVNLIDSLYLKEAGFSKSATKALSQIDLMKKAILARAFRGQL